MAYYLHALLQLYVLIIFADVIMSYFPDIRRQQWAYSLHKIADVAQKPIRELLPKGLPLDPSPMIVIIIINIIMSIL